MSMLEPLLKHDPASPRLTVYDESTGSRMEFSGVTLDNWANKIANMMTQEFDSDPDSAIRIDLPASWQAAVIPLGIIAAELTPLFQGDAELVFTDLEGYERWPDADDVVVVSNDPFGRGVVESGGTLPLGAIDFGPTVRFYGDQYFGASPELAQFRVDGVVDKRYLTTGWSTDDDFRNRILAPLAAGGSVVIVTGMASTQRLDEIATIEKVTARLES
ncbi:TIGR03089 family protein [Corynebacterium breve]|uniref:TIGR03089 family protein n=1 Tax=Corynebacterium breve TaxID=3049799 RepID=A0ABY8VJ91_9CORY|nr:TIGR03089 family protein [Corynebacterium breve]WIM68254.1 TIGR03089 family protein [Corynebacterium breve]